MKFDFLFTNTLFNKSIYSLFEDWNNFNSKDKLGMYLKSLLGLGFGSLSLTLVALIFNFEFFLSYINDLNLLYAFISYTISTFVMYYAYSFILMLRINRKLNIIYKHQKEFIEYIKELNFEKWSIHSQREFLTALCAENFINKMHFFDKLEDYYDFKVQEDINTETSEQVEKILASFKEEPKQDKESINFFND